MSQYDFGNLESPLTGTALINTHLEPWRNALHSCHSGTSRPSYAAPGMLWVNNASNPWVINIFDGTDDIPVGTINTSTNRFTLTGDVKAPSSAGLPIYNDAGTLIGTFGGSTSTKYVHEGELEVKGLLKPTAKVAFPDKGELTIASGSITVTGVHHTVDTEGDAATDDLDTIVGGSDGQILILRAANASRTVVLKHGTGNISTDGSADVELSGTAKEVMLKYDAELTDWHVISGGGGGGGGLIDRQVFTASGTWNKPLGCNSVVVTVVGGGGQGAAALTSGTSGGTSSFGSHCSASGGGGGSGGANGVNGASGGNGTSGDLNIKGGDGQGGNYYIGGNGGCSILGGGGKGSNTTSGAGNGGGYGAGGGGRVSSGSPPTYVGAGGGAGGAAIKYITSGLGSSETVTIGAGGTGTGAGAGSAGVVIVEAYS